MADLKITQLSELTTPDPTDVLPIVDVAGSGATKKIQVSNLVPSGATGPTGAIQFYNAGSFGGDARFIWDSASEQLSLGDGTADIVTVAGADGASVGTGIDIIAGRNTGDINYGSEVQINAGGTNGGTLGLYAGQANNGDGGNIDIAGGNAGTSGNGGQIFLTGGNGVDTFGDGGGIFFTGGNATSGNADGGFLELDAGNGFGAGGGGEILLTAGDGGTTGDGGAIAISGGEAGSGGGKGGNIALIAGRGKNTGNGGDVLVTPALAGATGGTAGNVVLGRQATGPTRDANFVYIPNSSNTMTGSPGKSYLGRSPLVFDTTNNKLWIYNSGWVSVTLS